MRLKKFALMVRARMSTMRRSMMGAVPVLLVLPISGCPSPHPASDWVQAFGYTPADIIAIDIGEFGYPYVPVSVEGTRLMLAFDTGNMVGVSISSGLFDQLGLTGDDSWTLVNSAGEIVRSLRVASAVEVSALGEDLGPRRVYELDHPTLTGLVGPTMLGGGHFTMDYGSRRMARSTARLPDSVPGFRPVSLVRSTRHPMLVLVRGTIEGRPVLVELDTGKSRTVINPALVSDLALKRGRQGVSIEHLRIANLSFEVPSAKEVDQTGIDPALPMPILVGVGSDILSGFVWTVDYDAGVLWVPSL
jgi:hypothetical protein